MGANAEITKEDVSVQWQTLSGETTDSQKNQFGLAVVTVSAEGAVIDQRVISFVGGAVERIADAVNPNEKKKRNILWKSNGNF